MTTFRQAFALSKDEVATAVPPGTIDLLEYSLERTRSGRDAGSLTIHLVPEPSQDAADPLNWALWRKIACTIAVCTYSFTANFASASIASALPFLASPVLFYPPVPFTSLTQLIAVSLPCSGWPSYTC